MVAWTAHAIVTYAKPIRRTVRLLVADLGIAVGLLVATPFVKGEWFNATIPGFWVMGALLAWAVRWGWRGGLVAAVALGGTDLLIRATSTRATGPTCSSSSSAGRSSATSASRCSRWPTSGTGPNEMPR